MSGLDNLAVEESFLLKLVRQRGKISRNIVQLVVRWILGEKFLCVFCIDGEACCVGGGVPRLMDCILLGYARIGLKLLKKVVGPDLMVALYSIVTRAG